MDAPTNIYGPDGTLCKKGDPIPDDWHEHMSDLADHFAATTATDGAVAPPRELAAMQERLATEQAEAPPAKVEMTGETSRQRHGRQR